MKFDIGFEYEILAPFNHAQLKRKVNKLCRGIEVTDDVSVKTTRETRLFEPAEIITPPLPESKAKKLMFDLHSMLRSEGCVTNKTCGLHINMSFDKSSRRFNPSLLIASVDDYLIAKSFDRHNNEYCVPWKLFVKKLDKLVTSGNKKLAKRYFAPYTLKSEFDRMTKSIFFQESTYEETPAYELLDNPFFDDKYMSVNLNHVYNDGYIEYRMIGGEMYLYSEDAILKAIEHFKQAQTVAHENQQQHRIENYLEWARN